MALSLWSSDDLAARIVELWPKQMLRSGMHVGSSDPMKAQAINAHLKQIDFMPTLKKALDIERAFGGSAILLGAADGQASLASPLNLNTVRKLDWVTLLEPDELSIDKRYEDPLAPSYGTVELYRLNTPRQSGTVIHESRLLIFPGIQIGSEAKRNGLWYGTSILDRVFDVLRDFNLTWGSASSLMVDFSQAVWKIKDLPSVIARDGGKLFQQRMQAMDLARSTIRAVVIDADSEDFRRDVTPLTGLPELLDRQITRISSAAGVPAMILFGESPGGLNATGEGNNRAWYDDLVSERKEKVDPHVEYVVDILSRIYKAPDWSITFPPLWQPTQAEIASIEKTEAETDQIRILSGVVTPEEVAASRFAGGEYNHRLQINIEERSELEPVDMPDPSDPQT